MVKKSKKERVVEYEEDDRICDLCETVIPPGNTFITIVPVIAQAEGGQWAPSGRDLTMDVCSSDCLSKNVGAVNLVFNTKILPETRSRKAAHDRKNKESQEEMDNYKQFAKQYAKATQTIPGTIQWTDSTNSIPNTSYTLSYQGTSSNSTSASDVFNSSNKSTI